MNRFIRVRIDSLEFLNAQGTTELQVSAIDEPLAAIVRMPALDQPRYTEQIARLRAEGRAFPVAADFFEMSEEDKCRELERAVGALFPEIMATVAPPPAARSAPVAQEPERRIEQIIHRTNGPFMVLLNSAGQYGMIDDVEINKLRGFLDDATVAARQPIASLLSDEIWDRELMDQPAALTLALRENRWALERVNGRLFANLDDRDIVAIRRARGW